MSPVCAPGFCSAEFSVVFLWSVTDSAVIIMLSDDEPETITSAMRLKPKFLGNMKDDLDTIVLTIEKLIQKRVKTAVCLD